MENTDMVKTVQTLEVDFYGPGGRGGGIRDKTIANEKLLAQLVKTIQHYFDVQRAETCHGKKAVKDLEDRLKNKEEGNAEVNVAEIKARSDVRVQIVVAIGMLANAGISLLGMWIMSGVKP